MHRTRLMTRFASLAALTCALIFAPLAAQAQAMTDFLEGALIGHVFRGAAYTAPTTVYIELLTAACTDSTTGTEVAAGNYARAAVATGTGTWAAPTGGNGTTSNVGTITFVVPSVGWGLVVGWAIRDALSAGNQLFCAALTTSKTINSGDTVTFPPGALTITFN